jgi:tRNA(Phe) wybutosine-synthesizing methylase Tyw3
MCNKLPYENPRMDKCIVDVIAKINYEGVYSTIASCCGHGVIDKTIVVKELATGKIFEYFSEWELKKQKKHRYYKFSRQLGVYHIPEELRTY